MSTSGTPGRQDATHPQPDTPIDPSTMRSINLSTVEFQVSFAPHIHYGEKWSEAMNTAYSVLFPASDVENLFPEPTTENANPTTLSNNTAETLLINHLVPLLVAQATQTISDDQKIRAGQLLRNGSLKIVRPNGSSIRPSNTSLLRAMQRAALDDGVLEIFVVLNHIYANFTNTPFTYLNWSHFRSHTPFPGDPPCPGITRATDPTPPAAATENTQEFREYIRTLSEAVSSSVSAVPTADDMENRLQQTIQQVSTSFGDQLRQGLSPNVTISLPNDFTTQIGTSISQGLQNVTIQSTVTPPATTPGNNTGNAPNPLAGTGTGRAIFNVAGLPQDVQTRYNSFRNGDIMTGTTLNTAFTDNNQRYHLDGTDRLILANGALFIINTFDEKGIFRHSVPCTDTSPVGIRKWYTLFQQNCWGYGLYVHPIWLLRSDNYWGFTAGDNPPGDHDLPSTLIIRLEMLKEPLFRLLSRSDMFPKTSNLPAIIANCHGDGYRALKQILFPIHPAFMPQPSTLVDGAPRQNKDEPLLQYYHSYMDYLQLRALILNQPGDITSKADRDIFLTNAHYSQYLLRCCRDDVNDPTKTHLFAATTIVDTLSSYLMQADSPAFTDFQRRERKLHAITRKSSKTSSKSSRPNTPVDFQLNAVAATPSPSSPNRYTTDDIVNQFYDEAVCLPIPEDDPEAEDLRDKYAVSLFAVSSTQNQTGRNHRNVVCIICKEPHTFDNCPVLQNAEFLRNHFIRFCQFLRRDNNFLHDGEKWQPVKSKGRRSPRPDSRNSNSSRASNGSRESAFRPLQAIGQEPSPNTHVTDNISLSSDEESSTSSSHEPGSYRDFLNRRRY